MPWSSPPDEPRPAPTTATGAGSVASHRPLPSPHRGAAEAPPGRHGSHHLPRPGGIHLLPGRRPVTGHRRHTTASGTARQRAAAGLLPRLPRPTWADLGAGVAVALVLVPQSLAYAVIAGMPPATGLVVGVAATLAAAPFVSSPFLQTGPVAITALLTFGSLSHLAEVGTSDWVGLAGLLALMVGVIRLGVGVLGLGAVSYMMSRPVMAGFIPAAGLVIAVGQLPVMLGVDASGRTSIGAVQAATSPASWGAAPTALAGLTIAIVVVARRTHRLVPAVLLAVVVGLVVSQAMGFDGAVIGPLPAVVPTPVLGFPWSRAGELVLPAMVIALVGFAEPAAIARTYAQRTRTRWDANREFVGQGVANVAAGLFGGFPAGGSFSRSAVAVQAGARTAWTGAFTGLLVLAALPAVGLLEQLPVAVLGAVIFTSVLPLLNPRPVSELRPWSRQQFAIAVATFVLAIGLAPQIHWAILVGVGLSIVAHLRREAHVAVPSWRDGRTLHVRPTGVLFFGSAHRLEDQVTARLGEHPDIDRLVLHMQRLGRTDVTGALALRDMIDHLSQAGVEVEVTDMTPTSRKILQRVLDAGT